MVEQQYQEVGVITYQYSCAGSCSLHRSLDNEQVGSPVACSVKQPAASSFSRNNLMNLSLFSLFDRKSSFFDLIIISSVNLIVGDIFSPVRLLCVTSFVEEPCWYPSNTIQLMVYHISGLHNQHTYCTLQYMSAHFTTVHDGAKHHHLIHASHQ